MKKLLALFLALAMLLTLVACGGSTESKTEESKSESKSESKADESKEESKDEGGEPAAAGRFDALQAVDEQVALLLYWHSLTPSVNEEPTEENPNVVNSSRYATAAWLEEHPNVSVEWCRNFERTEEWMTINYTAHTAPDTMFYWRATDWVERGFCITLDEVMASPNYYQAGSPVWKDMFPEYLFDGSEGTKMALSETNEIIGVPQVLDPGAATAYYYNIDLQNELGLSVPKTWKQLKDNLLAAREAGKVATVMYSNGMGMESGGSWDAQFSLNAAYFVPMIADNDFDGNGIVDFAEAFRTNWETGYWYLGNNVALNEYIDEYFWKYKTVLDDGVFDIDYKQPWKDGNVLYYEDGLWAIANYMSDTTLEFEVGMFPAPYQTAADSEYCCDIPMTESGPYKPTISVTINIMNPEIQEKPDYTVDYVVDWMKFMMTDENLSTQVEEVGGVLGATKGCRVAASLQDWFKQQFPQVPQGSYYLRCSLLSTSSADRDALFQEYMEDMITREQFVQRYDEMLYNDMNAYFAFEGNEDKAEEWESQYEWGMDWTTEAVKPPHMA